jgi:serine O-acetyltransferase
MTDEIWETIRTEVTDMAQNEPMLGSFLYSVVLNHGTLEDSLSFLLASKLESSTLSAASLRDLIDEAFKSDSDIPNAIREDIAAVCQRDPACEGYAHILMFYKGYHALQAYRAAHYYWKQDRKSLASFFQSRISEVFGVDIHPAARIGCGILIDHATSVVIGETAVVEDYVSMLHEVTLGGTGKESGDRHPKVRRGVLISAGAKILGNVEVGENAKVGGGAVVLEDVPPHTTVVGVPAKVVGTPNAEVPALEMNQHIDATVEGGDGI